MSCAPLLSSPLPSPPLPPFNKNKKYFVYDVEKNFLHSCCTCYFFFRSARACVLPVVIPHHKTSNRPQPYQQVFQMAMGATYTSSSTHTVWPPRKHIATTTQTDTSAKEGHPLKQHSSECTGVIRYVHRTVATSDQQGRSFPPPQTAKTG